VTVEDCVIEASSGTGIQFRDEKESNAAHDNRFESNTIEGNGRARPSPAVEILGAVSGLVFAKNTIRPGKAPSAGAGQRAAFLLGPAASKPVLRANRISPHEDGATVRARDLSP
jgi:hypothetical protein